MGGRRANRRLATVLTAGLALAMLPGAPARAQSIGPELAARLSEAQQRDYVLYLRARAAFDFELDAYWIAIEDRKEVRKRKRAAGTPYAAADYIAEQPPKYAGPALAPEIAKIVAEAKPPPPPTE